MKNLTPLTLLCAFVAVAISNSAPGQTKKKAKSVRTNPMQPIQDKPGLPRVLIIGDSISIGYTLPLRKALEGKANLHRPPTNCGPTTRGLEQIDAWLGDGKWDVIHFNWGLHDLKYLGPKGENLAQGKGGWDPVADPKRKGNRQQVPPAAYTANLEKLVQRLKKTGAKLIWRNTTPVPEGAKGRVPGDAAKYNAIAARVMEKHDIPTDDMYGYVKPRMDEIMRPANVHFTPEGSAWLAEQVAARIEKALE